MLSDEYQTIEAASVATIEDRKSQFHACVVPVESAAQANQQLKSWQAKFDTIADTVRVVKIGRDPDAQIDLGEGGKAASGILETLDGEGLTNICAIVVRAGAGASGSPQAYRDAVLNALRLAKKVKRILYDEVQFQVPQADMTLFVRLVTDGRGKIIHTQAGDPNRATVKIRRVQKEELIQTLRTKTKDRVRVA